jgi:anti-sigma factor (TIGR02949 family)
VIGDCEKCERLLQGYLDRELSDAEVAEAEEHLDGCDYCRRRYRFEASLRQYVRTTATERMPPGLFEKLAQLRSSEAGTFDPGAASL